MGSNVEPTMADRMADVYGFKIDEVARLADRFSGPQSLLRLQILDTNLPLPPEAVPATVAALTSPPANSYWPFTGDEDLRAAVSDLLVERTGHRYDPETEIVITSGSLEAMLDCLMAVVDPGDEVILTDPTYAGMVNRVQLVGGKPIFVPYRVVDAEWRLDLEALDAAVSPATRAFLLTNPSEPTGAVFDAGEWRAVCELCRERELVLIYNGLSERVLFDGRSPIHPVREPEMAERTLVIGSMSKEFRMIGWRVGWVAGPRRLLDTVSWAHVYNTGAPVGIARAGATAVLRGDHEHVQRCVAELERRRNTILTGLPGLPLIPPGGGWSILLDVVALGTDPATASKVLLRDGAVASTPMTGWGADVGARHIRFCFSMESVERLASLPERMAAAGLVPSLRG